MTNIQDEQKVNRLPTMRSPVLTNGFRCESTQHKIAAFRELPVGL
jgi:hypothetical protein